MDMSKPRGKLSVSSSATNNNGSVHSSNPGYATADLGARTYHRPQHNPITNLPTLRSRASSMRSQANSYGESSTGGRLWKVETVQSRYEGDQLTPEEALVPVKDIETNFEDENDSLTPFLKAVGSLFPHNRSLSAQYSDEFNLDETTLDFYLFAFGSYQQGSLPSDPSATMVHVKLLPRLLRGYKRIRKLWPLIDEFMKMPPYFYLDLTKIRRKKLNICQRVLAKTRAPENTKGGSLYEITNTSQFYPQVLLTNIYLHKCRAWIRKQYPPHASRVHQKLEVACLEDWVIPQREDQSLRNSHLLTRYKTTLETTMPVAVVSSSYEHTLPESISPWRKCELFKDKQHICARCLPYENYKGAILGEQIRIGEPIVQRKWSFTYEFEDLLTGTVIQGQIYTIGGLRGNFHEQMKRDLKRRKRKPGAIEIKRTHRTFLLEPYDQPKARKQSLLKTYKDQTEPLLFSTDLFAESPVSYNSMFPKLPSHNPLSAEAIENHDKYIKLWTMFSALESKDRDQKRRLKAKIRSLRKNSFR